MNFPQVKLLDAVFEAALAPYNYAAQALPRGGPFDAHLNGSNDLPRALQKFLYVAIQRTVATNLGVQVA